MFIYNGPVWIAIGVTCAFWTLFFVAMLPSKKEVEDRQKSKLQAEQNPNTPMLAKKGDSIWLLAQMEGKLLTVQSGDTKHPHTKVENNWYMSIQLETFEFEGETYQIVAVKPDPYYQRLIGGASPRLQA